MGILPMKNLVKQKAVITTAWKAVPRF